jgi:hypothetical protein
VKFPLLPFCPLVVASLLLPGCTGIDGPRPVEVRVRDAQTQAPLASGSYHIQQTTLMELGIDFPQVYPVHTTSGDGKLAGSPIRWTMYPWYQTQVNIKGDDVGESRFSFAAMPWEKQGTAKDWKRAKRVTKNGHDIEYQVAYP